MTKVFCKGLDNEDLYLYKSIYQDFMASSDYYGLYNNENELYCDITINLSGMFNLAENEIYISNDISNELLQNICSNGVFEDTKRKQKYNYGEYKIIKINTNKIKDYIKEEF